MHEALTKARERSGVRRSKSQKEVGGENLTAVRAFFSSHLCATQKECSEALGLSIMAVNRHVKVIRAEASLPPAPVEMEPPASVEHKASHVGAPAVFALELACQELNRAFGYAGGGDGHCYLVGSALDRADRRDIDIRMVMPDAEFDALFPGAQQRYWEHDPRWLIMTISISRWLSDLSGLPVDFQFQRQSNANEHHKGRRDAKGMIFATKENSNAE